MGRRLPVVLLSPAEVEAQSVGGGRRRLPEMAGRRASAPRDGRVVAQGREVAAAA